VVVVISMTDSGQVENEVEPVVESRGRLIGNKFHFDRLPIYFVMQKLVFRME
jgi:hypothetical protein